MVAAIVGRSSPQLEVTTAAATRNDERTARVRRRALSKSANAYILMKVVPSASSMYIVFEKHIRWAPSMTYKAEMKPAAVDP